MNIVYVKNVLELVFYFRLFFFFFVLWYSYVCLWIWSKGETKIDWNKKLITTWRLCSFFHALYSTDPKSSWANWFFFFILKLVSEWFTFCIFHFSPFQQKAGGYVYIYACELIRHTSSKVIRWNFCIADDITFDNRLVELAYSLFS